MLLQQRLPAQGHLAHGDAVVLHAQDAPLRGQLHAVHLDVAIQVLIRAGQPTLRSIPEGDGEDLRERPAVRRLRCARGY